MVEIAGQQYQHGTSRFYAIVPGGQGGSQKITTLKSVKFKRGAPKENTTNSEGETDGFVIKKTEQDGSITMKLSEYLNVLVPYLLKANDGLEIGQCQFTFVQTYGGRVNALHKLEMRLCMIQSEEFTSEDSQDPDMIDIPLNFQKCLLDGRPFIAYGDKE